jgi:aspartate aminotransferase-like enzyme
MQTENPVVFSASSGTGLLEMAIRSTTSKRAIVFSVGAFGNRWHEIAVGNGVPADLHEFEWGHGVDPAVVDRYLSTGDYDVATTTHNETSTGVMNHLGELSEVFAKYPDVVWCVDTVSSLGGVEIAVDSLGIDVCVTSSQKALGLPPGLSLASVSPKAEERARGVPNRGYYFDMLILLKYIARGFQYPSTPSISHLFALDAQLDRIEAEGIANRYARHARMADRVREWAGTHFALFPEVRWASQTVTCVRNTRSVSVAGLNERLGERGQMLSNGYGSLKEKTFRIAHMGDMLPAALEELLSNIEDILGLCAKSV